MAVARVEGESRRLPKVRTEEERRRLVGGEVMEGSGERARMRGRAATSSLRTLPLASYHSQAQPSSHPAYAVALFSLPIAPLLHSSPLTSSQPMPRRCLLLFRSRLLPWTLRCLRFLLLAPSPPARRPQSAQSFGFIIKKYAYSNAKTEDIWVVLEEETGEPVKDLMTTWTEQQGYPVIYAKLNGHDLGLEQTQFLSDGSSGPGMWIVHVT